VYQAIDPPSGIHSRPFDRCQLKRLFDRYQLKRLFNGCTKMRILTAPIFTAPVAMPFAQRLVAALIASALAPSALAVLLAAAALATAFAAALAPSALAVPLAAAALATALAAAALAPSALAVPLAAAALATALAAARPHKICQECVEIEDSPSKESPRIVVVRMRRVNVRGGTRRNDPLASAYRAHARKQSHAHSLKLRNAAFAIVILAAALTPSIIAPSARAARRTASVAVAATGAPPVAAASRTFSALAATARALAALAARAAAPAAPSALAAAALALSALAFAAFAAATLAPSALATALAATALTAAALAAAPPHLLRHTRQLLQRPANFDSARAIITKALQLLTKCAFKAHSKQHALQRKIKPCTPSRARRLARRAARLSQCDKDTATWIDDTVVWIKSRPARKLAMPLPPSAPPTWTPPPPEMDVLQTNITAPPPLLPQASARKICNSACMPACACSKVKSVTQTEERFAFDDPGLPAGRAAGEPLKIRLPGGGALLLCVLPGASADAVVRRAAAACGLAPSQLALFCGGRRLGGPAPLSRAGGVRSGGTLRVVQRLAGGGAGAGRMRDAPKTKQAAAARLVMEQAAAEEPVRVAAEEASRLATEQAAAEKAARVTAARLATKQAAAEEVARVAAEEAARLATEQAATEEPARVAADRPPHLLPAREVKVDEDKMVEWTKRGGTELEAVLKSGAAVLLDAEWVIARAASGGVLLPRQALPGEAFISLSEVQAGTGKHDLTVVCVSHCWLQPDHPDPRGYNLRAIARALASLTSKGRGVNPKCFGVFLDFCYIH